MSDKLKEQIAVGIFAFIWAAGGMYWVLTLDRPATVTYDCSISEISPDFPIEVREECRKLRAQSGRF